MKYTFLVVCALVLGSVLPSQEVKLDGLLEGSPVGGTCTKNEDCLDYETSTECNTVIGACFCRAAFEPYKPPGETHPICVGIVHELGKECYITSQCTKGEPGDWSDCLPSEDDEDKLVCSCVEEAINEPGEHKCYPKRFEVGEQCDKNAQCKFSMTDYSECLDNECICTISVAIPSPDMDKCLPIRNDLFEECVVKEQCTLGKPGLLSDCLEPWQEPESHFLLDPPNLICNCTESAIYDPDDSQFPQKCFPRREHVDEICEVNAQCSINLGTLSECKDQTPEKICACLDDQSVASTKKDFCLPIVNEIGGECKESQQCTEGIPGDLSACINSTTDPTQLICKCSDDAINQPGKHKCHAKALIVDDPCVEEAQCTANLGDLSYCFIETGDEGKCDCVRGSIPRQNRTHCLAVRNQLGDECSEDQQCTEGLLTEYSVCQDNQCQCNSDGVAEPGEHICRKRAEHVGEKCEQNAQCKANLGDLSECVARDHCRCLPNYAVPSNDETLCLPILHSIGARCEEPQQCQHGTPGEQSTCNEDKQCACAEGATNQPGNHKCYKIAETIGATCEVHMQCQMKLGDLSECTSENGCQCLVGVSIANHDNTACLPIINNIGGECLENTQCTSGTLGKESECRMNDQIPNVNVCLCKRDAIKDPLQDICYRKAEYVDDQCTIDLQCTEGLGEMSRCNNAQHHCECLPGFKPNLEGQKPRSRCIPAGIHIGDPCYDRAQCVGIPGQSSICSSGRCGCLEGYTESIKLDDCLSIRNQLGDSCTEPQQCQQGIPGRFSNCVLSGTGLDKICNCTNNAINEAGKHKCYLKAVEVGGPCEVNVQCVANLKRSQCLEGKCECLEENRPSTNNTECLPIKYLQQTCVDDNQCNHIENAICQAEDESQASICQCATGYIRHPNIANFPNTCIKLAEEIGQSCADHPDQCQLLGAECRSGETCECDPTSEVAGQDNKTCLDIVPDLHKACQESPQCQVNNSLCLNGSCVCDGRRFVEAQQQDNLCLPILSQIGQNCQENIQCSSGISEKTECFNGVCRCAYPFEFYETNCYRPTKLYGYCEVDEECRLGVNKFAMCNRQDQRCACAKPAFPMGEMCWEPKIVGDQCQENLECTVSILGSSFCDNSTGTCQCQVGYSTKDNLFCAKNENGGQTILTSSMAIVLSFFMVALINDHGHGY